MNSEICVIGICNECGNKWVTQENASDNITKECPECGSIPKREWGDNTQSRVGVTTPTPTA